MTSLGDFRWDLLSSKFVWNFPKTTFKIVSPETLSETSTIPIQCLDKNFAKRVIPNHRSHVGK
jgi:hypothetical protein